MAPRKPLVSVSAYTKEISSSQLVKQTREVVFVVDANGDLWRGERDKWEKIV